MKQIFINIPVEDLEKSTNFYSKLGFENYPLFTFENQKCLSWGEQILVMLQPIKRNTLPIERPLSDMVNCIKPSFTLPVESFDKVNELVENGLSCGGIETSPMVDEGYMQLRTIQDFDGHNWGIIYLDLEKFKAIKNRH